MKKLLFFALILSLGILPMFARSVTASFSPSTMFANNISTVSFDPGEPGQQPVLTYLTINHTGQQFQMRMQIKWNGRDLLPGSGVIFTTNNSLPAAGGVISMTNQDIISNQTSEYFGLPQPSISIDDIINRIPIFKDAFLAGYFPDGALSIHVWVVEGTASNPDWGTPTTFTIQIQNAGNIALITPGRPIGQNPPLISQMPVTFLWNAIFTGHNRFSILVKEFPPNLMPTSSNVQTAGTVVYQTPPPPEPAPLFQFSDYLPFRDGYYYAWKVSTQLYNESGTASGTGLNSNWYVFKYTSDTATNEVPEEILTLFSFLNSPVLQNLFNAGYAPTGVVEFNGRVYTGQEALDLINSLIGKNLEISVSN